MPVEKQKVLNDAIQILNNENQAWEVTVENDTIIAKWKWMDARFFSPTSITDEVRSYTFTVTLGDNGKWREKDYFQNKTASLKPGKFSLGCSSFKGHASSFSFTIGLGENKNTGETGIITNEFNTNTIKEPIRQYLTQCGWKKKGLF